MAEIRFPDLRFSGLYLYPTASAHCWVRFTPFEVERMRMYGDLEFYVQAEIWGADSWFYGSDDHLVTFDRIIFLPSGMIPRRNEFVRFDQDWPMPYFDEDVWFQGGIDDLYASFYLSNNWGDLIRKNSPEISRIFDFRDWNFGF